MTYDSWQNQGRQQHGWFGHGTSPHDHKPDRPEANAPDMSGQRAPTSADDGPSRRADRDRIARLVKAAAATAPPAMGVGAISLAAELTGGAAIGSVAIPVAAVALLLAAGWGLYELMPEYDPRLIHEVNLFGHPGIAAVMDETQDKVAFAVPGAPGKPTSVVIWKVETLPPSPLAEGLSPPVIVDRQGRIMGTYLYGSKTIVLTAAGEKALEEAASQGNGQIAPRDEEERGLVDGWRKEGKTPLEIQILLDARQAGQGGAAADQAESGASADPARAAVEKRTRKFREQVLAGDKAVADAITRGDLKPGDVEAHHVIPIASAGKKMGEFVAGGWKSNDVENGIMLPTNEEAQRKLEKITGEKRPIHQGGHREYIEEVDQEVREMIKEVDGSRVQKGTPEYGTAIKEGLRNLLKEMRRRLGGKDKVTMIEQSHEGVG